MASITEIVSATARRSGFAKPNRFKVDFSSLTSANLILIGGGNLLTNAEDMNFFCDSISLPGRQINTTEFGAWHHAIKVPTGYVEDDIEMTFNLTNDYFVKKMLDAWANKVINEDTYHVQYDNEYKFDLIINQLDDRNNVIYTIQVFGAFPYSVKSIALDNNSESTISKCQATFAYDYFKAITTN